MSSWQQHSRTRSTLCTHQWNKLILLFANCPRRRYGFCRFRRCRRLFEHCGRRLFDDYNMILASTWSGGWFKTRGRSNLGLKRKKMIQKYRIIRTFGGCFNLRIWRILPKITNGKIKVFPWTQEIHIIYMYNNITHWFLWFLRREEDQFFIFCADQWF